MMRNTVIEIGRYVRERREILGLLQPQLGAIAGLSTRTIQLIEAGKANPSLETILALTDALGLEIKLGVREANHDTTVRK